MPSRATLRAQLALYLVTDSPERCRYGLLDTVKRAVEGGVSIVQYRRYGADDALMLEEASALRDYLRSVQVPLIINNKLELALAVDADGLHIGQRDISPQEARAGLGKDKILGLTVNNREQLLRAPHELLDYIGMGPIFPTISKEKPAPCLGIAGFDELAALSPLPVVGIGGLDVPRVQELYATSSAAAGVALVSAICASADPAAVARALREAMAAANN